jgi:hypothetical protein
MSILIRVFLLAALALRVAAVPQAATSVKCAAVKKGCSNSKAAISAYCTSYLKITTRTTTATSFVKTV